MAMRALALSIVCLVPIALRATVLLPAEFREIVNGADIIAYGGWSRPRWSRATIANSRHAGDLQVGTT